MYAAVTSDWHMGNKGHADDCCYTKLYTLCESMAELPGIIILNGDIFELWQFSFGAIVNANKDTFRIIDGIFYQSNKTVYYHPGNHDASADFLEVKDLFKRCNFQEYHHGITAWEIEHGNRFDTWNNGESPLLPFAHGITFIAGLLERAIPGFDERWFDMRSRISPAQYSPEKVQKIHDKAEQYASEKKIRLCYGHTHHQHIHNGDGWQVVNDGCVVDGVATYALLWEDGANIVSI